MRLPKLKWLLAYRCVSAIVALVVSSNLWGEAKAQGVDHCTQPTDETYQVQAGLAREAIEREDFEAALVIYQWAFEHYPYALPYYSAARAYHRLGRTDEAAEAYSNFLEYSAGCETENVQNLRPLARRYRREIVRAREDDEDDSEEDEDANGNTDAAVDTQAPMQHDHRLVTIYGVDVYGPATADAGDMEREFWGDVDIVVGRAQERVTRGLRAWARQERAESLAQEDALPVVPIVVLSAGGAFVLTTIIVDSTAGLSALEETNEASIRGDRVGYDAAYEDLLDMRTLETWGYGLGIAGIAVGGVWLLIEILGDDSPDASVQAAMQPGGLQLGFSF